MITKIQTPALTEKGNPYIPQRTGASLGGLAGFFTGISKTIETDTFQNAAKSIKFDKAASLGTNFKSLGKAGLLAGAVVLIASMTGKIGEALGGIWDMSANMDRRAQADGEAVIRKQSAAAAGED